ncbi:hypothetical protein PHOSAC3_150004 [Mesotoga infera]|nr:hypothetical protein PHOSAC3_150004 [Mesotoga infera]
MMPESPKKSSALGRLVAKAKMAEATTVIITIILFMLAPPVGDVI